MLVLEIVDECIFIGYLCVATVLPQGVSFKLVRVIFDCLASSKNPFGAYKKYRSPSRTRVAVTSEALLKAFENRSPIS